MDNIKICEKYRKKIVEIMNKDYDCEIPDKMRSKEFQSIIKKMLKEFFPDCEIIPVKGCWCEAHGWLKKPSGACVYYAFEDYRYWDWDRKILYRSAKDEKDYTGGGNHFSYDLTELKHDIEQMFDFIERR